MRNFPTASPVGDRAPIADRDIHVPKVAVQTPFRARLVIIELQLTLVRFGGPSRVMFPSQHFGFVSPTDLKLFRVD